MKRSFPLIVLLLLFGTTFSAELKWHGFDEGLERAEKENKSVLIDFYTDWCHWCKVMDEKTFNEAAVSDKLESRFITVRVQAEDQSVRVNYQDQTFTHPELTRAFGVTGFPSIAFLNENGEPITIVPGFIPPEEFIHILNYIDMKCYEKKMSYEEFRKKLDCEQ